jgi:methionyl-tRNA formyltransferase
MNIAVFGTPQLSADIFETLSQIPKIKMVAAVTAPDRPAGRGKKLTPPPVKTWAEEKGISIYQPEKPDMTLAKELKKMDVELLVVIAYGYIFSKEFLSFAPPAWNLHFSLLPKYRGTSPVQTAILSREQISGMTVFCITPGMDDGPILGQQEIEISQKRADAVFEDMKNIGSLLLKELLVQKAKDEDILEIPQNESEATFCQKIEKNDGFLEPEKETAESALRKIRAYFPWPGTSVEYKEKRLKILDAIVSEKKLNAGQFQFEKTGTYLGFHSGTLELTEVQPEGKRPMSGLQFARGQHHS